jgi:hypothetical protein
MKRTQINTDYFEQPRLMAPMKCFSLITECHQLEVHPRVAFESMMLENLMNLMTNNSNMKCTQHTTTSTKYHVHHWPEKDQLTEHANTVKAKYRTSQPLATISTQLDRKMHRSS